MQHQGGGRRASGQPGQNSTRRNRSPHKSTYFLRCKRVEVACSLRDTQNTNGATLLARQINQYPAKVNKQTKTTAVGPSTTQQCKINAARARGTRSTGTYSIHLSPVRSGSALVAHPVGRRNHSVVDQDRPAPSSAIRNDLLSTIRSTVTIIDTPPDGTEHYRRNGVSRRIGAL